MSYKISPKPIFKSVIVSLITILFFGSCQKILNLEETPVLPPLINTADLTTKVKSSVSGFVTDGNDVAIKDASILIGNTTVLTDKYGFFEVRNVQVVQNAAVVAVSKTGFFKGIKTYIATENKSAFFRIKLIPKTSAGSVNGAAGGVVTLTSGLSINFPASAIVNASTNAAYTGVVKVAAFYINPTATDLNSIMPGDLRGLNTDGELKLLTTYGMTAVELTGAGGELLQIAARKKATLTMPIPAALSSTAPTTIPMWYFDETNGLWKQEGVGTKIGNNYVGDVSHFSFWNYDVPANYVQFNCTVVNTAGQPIQNAFVKISLVSNSNIAGYGHTDSSGYVSGAIPNNAQLKLEVFGNISCLGTPAFSQNFSTTNTNVAFGNVTINTVISIATLVGTVKNCAGAPVTNGYIIIREGNLYNRVALSNTGSYNFNKLFCSFPTQITLIGEDVTNLQQNLPITYMVNAAGINNIPPITACGVSTQQFINYTINGAAYSLTAPTDSLRFDSGMPFNNNTATINGMSNNNNNSNLYIAMNGAGIGLNSAQSLLTFSTFQINDSSTITTPILVNITEYGAVGQFVGGNLTGALTGPPPTNLIYNITCNFRIRRFN